MTDLTEEQLDLLRAVRSDYGKHTRTVKEDYYSNAFSMTVVRRRLNRLRDMDLVRDEREEWDAVWFLTEAGMRALRRIER